MKKIKFNWGTGILIVIILFFVSVAIRIFIAYQYDVDLITPEYYPKEIEHQKHIDRMQNTSDLQEKPQITLQNDTVVVSFPGSYEKDSLTGTILLYRPSEMDKDIKIALNPDHSLMQKIPAGSLLKGKYICKIEWDYKGKGYYSEADLFIEKNNE